MSTTRERDAEFLAHVGVKGMRWGHRKAEDASSSNASVPKTSGRKERKIKKEAAREAGRKADAKKVRDLVDLSLKSPDVLITLNGQTIVTGKEFSNHMRAGGLMNAKTTTVFARLSGNTYVMEK